MLVRTTYMLFKGIVRRDHHILMVIGLISKLLSVANLLSSDVGKPFYKCNELSSLMNY